MGDLVALTAAEPYMRDRGMAHAADGSLFVAEADGEVVGYAAMMRVDDAAHLCEIDVAPEHGGRGLGRRLVAAGEAWGRARGLAAMTLTTFIDVPWNGPWYARLGFAPFPEAEWGPEHRAIWRGQVESALDHTRRFMMIRRFGGESAAALLR